MPFFSVVITTFNRSEKLLRAINSVLSQTFKDFEIIIVNDGSTENYAEVEKFVASYPSTIFYYKKMNEERSIARNFGVSKSQGEFICFLDDDDFFLEQHLQILHETIQKQNKAAAIYHTYPIILNKENKEEKIKIIDNKTSLNNIEYYLTDGLMTVNCTCFAKQILLEFPFNSKFRMAEDIFQRSLAMTKYNVFAIAEYTAIYDKTGGNTSGDSKFSTLKNYLFSYNELFKIKEIVDRVSIKTRKIILFNYNNLAINYRRKELSIIQLCGYYIKLLFLKPNFNTLVLVLKNLRWKILKK